MLLPPAPVPTGWADQQQITLIAMFNKLNRLFRPATPLAQNPRDNIAPIASPCPVTAGLDAAPFPVRARPARDLRGGWHAYTARLEQMKKELNAWVKGGQEGENRKEAKQRIIACFLERKTELSLKRLQLKALPDCLGNLTSLTALYLDDNRLTELPQGIGKLTALESLRVAHNHLTELPEWTGKLTSLKKLYLDHNHLKELPERLGELTALAVLHVDDNQLTKLPERLGELTSLDELFVKNNQLKELPEYIGKLPSLKKLSVDGNPLTFLSEEIRNMRAFLKMNWYRSESQKMAFDQLLSSLPFTRPAGR
ncbi:leucine-rich repeat domain-containing protein [Actimicrobium sp. CCI2.3]|uniref:leucine-rich repeat domain-containing protein n=1 Tax=Actimicrobium sp. CCI2.3 TaxID=3048616 RepID=UPI002AB573F0|nr:leucine-rich repeat domain-containing protein [Actimicrobium sp. CCI2.3]MDY7576198.1 leucine-rich repeat domain-containing protein [Actimicrobium sp. CCI2.3]MEB0020597.1 hypothetical protein [Actimicrobium sp. CCI2.3]